MIRQLIWFLLGWEGPIPSHAYSAAEYAIAVGGAGIALALYPVWFRLGFAISHRGRVARLGGWMAAITLAVGWYTLALDLLLFNTMLVVIPALFLLLAGVALYLFLNRLV